MVKLPEAPSVFINCPFDPTYKKVFEAIIFAVCALRFEPQCALGADDGSVERLTKILELISQCPCGIHDISFMKLDPGTRLPRQNMPFELGLFLGIEFAMSKRTRKTRKSCLILDRDKWRYRKSISDLSGRDIRAYKGSPRSAIAVVRNWLVTESKREDAPGATFIEQQYRRFKRRLPELCAITKRNVNELQFAEYRSSVQTWLKLDA